MMIIPYQKREFVHFKNENAKSDENMNLEEHERVGNCSSWTFRVSLSYERMRPSLQGQRIILED